jgi:hypothetical protein
MDYVAHHLLLLALINIPVYLLIGKLFFDDWEDFGECVRFWFTPEWISWLSGELGEEWWADLRLVAFIGVCSLVVYGEYHLLYAKTDQAVASAQRQHASTAVHGSP